MTGILSTLATIWRLAIPYFRSEDRWPGRALLGAVLAIELAVVAVTVLLNQWNARFYNALQDRNWDTFVRELMFFCVLAALLVVLRVYQLYLNQWLQIRWRRWMTSRYLDRWLDQANHYRMQLLGDAADNPDQRIAEDVKQFIELGLSIGVGLLGAVVSLGSFVVILWGLSAAAPLTIYGVAWNIPGYLVWAALAYAAAGTLLTHLIGRPLIPLNFNQQRYEADFRFNLVRVRENSEQIALLDGETGGTHAAARSFPCGGGKLAAHHVAAEEAHLPDRRLQSGIRRVSRHRGEPGLFRRPYPARRTDADRRCVQQRADRAVLLCRQLCAHCRMARRDRAARGL